MKKFTLLFVATLFSALSFAALNPYAYGLKSTLNADQTELTVNYSLNATATNVDFVLLDGDKVIKTVNLNNKGLAKGSYTATVALDDPNMPLGKKLTWKLEVKGAVVSGYTMHDVKYNAYHPSSVDIDNNPENETFGLILTNEALHESKDKTGYLSTGYGAGIFAFNAAFEYQEKYNGKHIAIVAHKAPQLAIQVLTQGKTWQQAIEEDWRKTKAWKPGWEYTIN